MKAFLAWLKDNIVWGTLAGLADVAQGLVADDPE
jgi:hypothetical protein